DPLAVAVDEAHARGLELHAWINVYPAWVGETPPTPAEPEPMVPRFNRLFDDQWVVWDRHQQPMQLNSHYLWSNPGHQAVQEHIAAVGYDIVARYYVDGLHLDNVRYPGWEYSRDPITLEAVAQAQAQEPDLDRKEWQRRQVNQLVARLHASIQRLKPGLALSAAVWPVYLETMEWWSAGDGYDGFCQDSVGWVHEQIVELICPMLYLASITTDDAQYRALVEDFVARAGGEHVVAGIAAAYDDFAVIARRIDLARAAGAAGQSLFSYGHVNQRGYWDQFQQGPYATPARPLLPQTFRQRVSELLQRGEGPATPFQQ
ncbi:MAG TPA: family 10 glycosylhydrolase, partial [Anaerolineae bacterium]|nr:family 10 glycosylhydrolase [Anaerolineae bacterium]